MKLMTVTVVTLADAFDKLEFIMISAVRQSFDLDGDET